MPKENKTKYAILGILSLAPMSGYDIKKLTDNSIGHFWNENFGHIYPMLKRMETERLVSRRVSQTPGRPDRSVFAVTDAGTRALADWLSHDPEEQPVRIELLLQLFFAKTVPVSVVIGKIRREKALNESRLAVYETVERHLSEGDAHSGQPDIPFWLMTLSFGKHRSRAAVAWCEETIKTLVDMQSDPGGAPAGKPGGFTPHDV